MLEDKHKRIYQWIMRRWNAHTVATNSFVALLVSLIVVDVIDINPHSSWYWCVAGFMVILLYVARWTREDGLEMVAFQALRLGASSPSPSTGAVPVRGTSLHSKAPPASKGP